MKKSVKFLAPLTVLSLVLVAQPAHGQTGTTPDPNTLLTQAQTALTKAGSGHLVGAIDEVITGKDSGHIILAVAGDVKWKKPIAAQLTANLTVEVPGVETPIKQSLQLLDYKQQFAVKAPGQKWSCTSLKNASKTLGTTGASVPVTSKTTDSHGAPVLIGAEAVNGVPAWHVQVRGTVTAKQKQTKNNKTKTVTSKLPFTADAYVAQTTSNLVRIVVSTATSSKGDNLAITESADLSNYGEPVTVTLPKACSAKKAKSSKAADLLFQGLSLLMRPAALLRGESI